MRNLDELLIREWLMRPNLTTQVVYHYTSAAGLIGILSSGVIRGTNAAFLNDLSEIDYGRSVCIELLEEERTSRSSEADRILIHRASELVRDSDTPYEVYIASFSERRDVLSQWRGYGSGDGRFCLGFQVSQFSERDVLRLPRPVEYSIEGQRNQVRHAVDAVCRATSERATDQESWAAAGTLAFHLRRIMFSLKHPGFEEEREWRSAATIVEADDLSSVSFTPFKGAPRPVITMLAGSRTTPRLPVVEVCIGPSERPKATFQATRLLLQKYGYADVSIRETKIPFSG